MSFSAVLDSLSSFVTTYSSIHSSFPLPLHLHASPLKKEAGVGVGVVEEAVLGSQESILKVRFQSHRKALKKTPEL